MWFLCVCGAAVFTMAQLVTVFGSLANHMLSRYSRNITDCEPKSDDTCMHSMNNYHWYQFQWLLTVQYIELQCLCTSVQCLPIPSDTWCPYLSKCLDSTQCTTCQFHASPMPCTTTPVAVMLTSYMYCVGFVDLHLSHCEVLLPPLVLSISSHSLLITDPFQRGLVNGHLMLHHDIILSLSLGRLEVVNQVFRAWFGFLESLLM